MARFALSAATSRRISTAFADSRCVDSCNAAIDFLFGIPAKCLLASPFTYAPLKEKEEASAVKPAVPKVAKPGKGFITRAAEDGAPMLLHTSWSDRERHWARDWRALALTQVHHGSRTKRIPPRHVPNTGRYSSPLGKWPAADCARRLERPRVPRGSHRGTTSPAIA